MILYFMINYVRQSVKASIVTFSVKLNVKKSNVIPPTNEILFACKLQGDGKFHSTSKCLELVKEIDLNSSKIY